MKQTPIPVEITFVDFKCPHCGEAVSFPDQWIGRPQTCPACSQILIVPQPGAEFGLRLPIPFQTSRLVFRRLGPADANDLLEIVGDAEVARNYEWCPMDEQEVQVWLENDPKMPPLQPGSNFYLALGLLGEPKLAGLAAMSYRDKGNSEMTVDICVNPNYQRRGFGTEAFRGVMQLVFAGLNTHRLCTWCHSRNQAGVHMLEKAGLRREGEFIKCKLMRGEWVDVVQYALLREEYGSGAQGKPSQHLSATLGRSS